MLKSVEALDAISLKARIAQLSNLIETHERASAKYRATAEEGDCEVGSAEWNSLLNQAKFELREANRYRRQRQRAKILLGGLRK